MRTQAVSSTKAATTPIASSASTMEKQADGVRGRKTCMRAPNSIVNLSECVFSNTSKSEGGFVKVDIMSDDKKELKMEKVVNLVVDEESTVSTESDLDSDESSYYDSDYDSDEDEEEEYDEEVALILEDARKLKFLAQAFLHPEKKVEADPETLGRNYFNRPSAEPTETPEEAEERAMILKDAASLKELAVQYTHPEIGVTKANDAATFGRNYFNRPSADETKSFEEAEEHAQILEDARKLKKLAKAYLHPEVGVSTSNPTLFGRNYFDRPSAVETESFEEAEERAMILADAAALKKLAVQYTHPEVKVVADPTCYGRNYFNRPSAIDTETAEEAEERARVLADAAALKKLAVDYAHPELGVTSSDPTSYGRNYFNRASAEDTESFEEAEERARVLADAAALKKLAVDYCHPEIGVSSSDPASFGRNYFNRASAEDSETFEEAEERARVLADAAALKKLAVDYCHPEIGVTSTDPTLFGRNYFNRASAEDSETFEEAEERAQILAEAAALKKLAVDYCHPEVGVTSTDPTLFGRNYFNRASAEDSETFEEAEERARVLADAAALKKLAVDYCHPEIGVSSSDPASFGRNYFNRASAEDIETVEEAEERAQILAEAAALKKLAVGYLHPEVGVTSSDPASFGRNYFNRASADETESYEEAEERAQILAEAAALKKLAVGYLHPEVGVSSSDPTSFGRNYFNRASAEDTENVEEAEERARVLADAAALKKLAVDYCHPEIGVSSSDPASFGRNYFNRASAEDTETYEEAEERAQILADALAMKKLAVQYTHPEIGVNVTDASAFARSYFDRPSAAEIETVEEAEERARILADARELKKLAVDYCHPEVGVTSSDPTSFGRNYFNRPSAEPTLSLEESGGRAQILADAAALKKLAVDYGHPEIGVTNSDPTTFARNIYKPDPQYVASVNTAPPPMQSYYYEESIAQDTASTDLPFDLDEEFDDMRENFMNFQPQQSHVPIDTGMKKHKHREGSDDEEGNLSRSPSSVFLLGLDA